MSSFPPGQETKKLRWEEQIISVFDCQNILGQTQSVLTEFTVLSSTSKEEEY